MLQYSLKNDIASSFEPKSIFLHESANNAIFPTMMILNQKAFFLHESANNAIFPTMMILNQKAFFFT
jgi:hypothetical protein